MKLFKKKQYAADDYTVAMLPQNRLQIFFDVLKLHWKSLLLLGLIFFLFSLPLSVVSLLEQLEYANLVEYELDQEQFAYVWFEQMVVFELLKIPCIIIVFVGLSGIIRTIRQYAWEENVSFSYDFMQGLKSNLGYMILIGLILGVCNLVSAICASQVAFVENTIQVVMMYVPLLLLCLFILPLIMYQTIIVSIYNVKFGTTLKMAMITFAQTPLKTYLAILCCVPLLVLLVIPNIICNAIGCFVATMLFPIVFLGLYLFALNGLDKAVNKQYYPELVGRGIFNIDTTQCEQE